MIVDLHGSLIHLNILKSIIILRLKNIWNPRFYNILLEKSVRCVKCYGPVTAGFPAEPGRPGDLNIICPVLEIAWNLSPKVRKPGQNKKLSRKPGLLRYTFQYYIETISSKFCDFRTRLASAFWCKNSLQYNLENGFFDLDKTWNLLAKKTGNPEWDKDGSYNSLKTWGWMDYI